MMVFVEVPFSGNMDSVAIAKMIFAVKAKKIHLTEHFAIGLRSEI